MVGIVVVLGVGWEVSKQAVTPYPFAAVSIPAGQTIDAAHIEWRRIPQGLAPTPDLTFATALVDIAAGDPITTSVAGSPPAIPGTWWSVPVMLPASVAHGTPVRLSLADGRSIRGIVDTPGSEDPFGLDQPGSVAVPEEVADAVARDAGDGSLVVLLPPSGQSRTNEIAPNATQ